MSRAEVESAPSAAGRATPARGAAVAALLAVESGGLTIPAAIEASIGDTARSGDDRAFLHELVTGVLRYRLYLDWALQQVAHETPYSRQPEMKQILRLGAYQLIFLDRVPAYAAIDQSVELAKARLGPASAPLANALLRKLAKRHTELMIPDLLEQPLEHIAIKYAHPRWLVKRWVKRYGAQRAMILCRANNEPAPLTVRVNRLKLGPADYQHLLQTKGIASTPCAYSSVGLRVEHAGPVTDLPGYGSGWFYVQDEASQLVALLLAPRPGETVLDACAAPGGKATQIAEMMNNQGEMIALDRDAERLLLVEENGKRLGITMIRTAVGDATQELTHLGKGRFDRILVDAPCSGLGVLRRHPEGKWTKDEGSILRSAQAASQIVANVSALLKSKGVLVYSTCSSEPEENQGVIEAFLSRHRNFRSEDPRPLLPEAARTLVNDHGYFSTVLKGGGMDGFFAARLVRVK